MSHPVGLTITYRAFSDPADPFSFAETKRTIMLRTDIDDDLELCEAVFAATNTYGDMHREIWDRLQPLPAGRSHTSLSVIFDRGDYVSILRMGGPRRTYEVADCGFKEVTS